MDTLIKDGDFSVDNARRIITITDVEEIIQRALIRLTVKKGSFIFDTTLGSDLYKVDINNASEERLLMIVREALLALREVEVIGVEKSINNSSEAMSLTVYLRINGEEAIVELDNKGE